MASSTFEPMKLQPELLLVEPIPLIPLRILLFLFSVSSGGGECTPGNAAIMRAVGISKNTLTKWTRWLKKRGWIFRVARTQTGNQRIYIRVPHRLRPAKPASVVATTEAQFKVV
jgi:hypothetical protein